MLQVPGVLELPEGGVGPAFAAGLDLAAGGLHFTHSGRWPHTALSGSEVTVPLVPLSKSQ